MIGIGLELLGQGWRMMGGTFRIRVKVRAKDRARDRDRDSGWG